ncbi:MAG: O-antigen ligase family protein [Candidatus Omnitrophica bacterium]|nr:O-antigen ligase family protein [Candidatus Omnitrophota bacterium]
MSGDYLVLGLVILLSVFRQKIYPPLFLFLYLLVDPVESTGIAGALNFSLTYRIAASFFIVSALTSFSRLWKERNLSKMNHRLFIAGLIAVFYMMWIYISSIYFNFSSYLILLNTIQFFGPYAMIIALAYYRENFARRLFVFYLFLQITLGALIIIIPDSFLSVLQGVNYTASFKSDYFFGQDSYMLYGSRVSAQFYNTIILSFYSAIGLALCIYIIKVGKQIAWRIAGAIFLVICIWLQLISATRGVLMGIIFGYFAIFFRLKAWIKIGISLITLVVIYLIITSSILSKISYEPLGPIIDRFSEIATGDKSIESRVVAIEKFNQDIFVRPILGYGDYELTVQAYPGSLPHQLMLYIAAIYGIPAGICVTLLLILGIIPVFKSKKIRQGETKKLEVPDTLLEFHRRNLGLFFGVITIFLNMTNGTGGFVLPWVTLAVAIYYWAEG